MTATFPHIFLVEDNPGDVELLQIAFERNGFVPRVTVATNGEVALTLLHELAAADNLPTLILLDLNMPRMSGIEVLRTIAVQPWGAEVATVVWTSSISARDREQCLALGARDFLIKPDRIGAYIRLIEHLRRYLGQP